MEETIGGVIKCSFEGSGVRKKIVGKNETDGEDSSPGTRARAEA